MADKIVEPLENISENMNFDKFVKSALSRKENKFERLTKAYKNMQCEQETLTKLYE